MLKPYDRPGSTDDVRSELTEAPTAPASLIKKKAASKKKARTTKLFVLDTNVLMHDPTSLFRFEEHDVYLPIGTLEELDDHKKGLSDVSRNARQASRFLDEIVSTIAKSGGVAGDISRGIALTAKAGEAPTGRLFLQTEAIASDLPATLPMGKVDNQILAVVRHLQRANPQRQVILVTKDINMRIKARALALAAEDYSNDKVLEDSDLLYTGVLKLPADFWDTHGKDMESWKKEGHTYYRVRGPMVPQLYVNQFVYDESGDRPLYAVVKERSGRVAVLETLRDYSHAKNSVWGITSRNREQNFALNLLMNPAVDFVTLLGQAGTGKTLLALAAGLTQVLDEKRYTEIIVTRVTVPIGEDIGFLPGTEEEKMEPWMGALMDNLEVLTHSQEGGTWGRAATNDLLRNRIKIRSLNFMRGRTFLNKFIILDEAQNLTPKQMKAIVTRAGPGTKLVCLGNIAQIDTPYLTETTTGLTYVVNRFRGWVHGGHITMVRGERSRLADFASETL